MIDYKLYEVNCYEKTVEFKIFATNDDNEGLFIWDFDRKNYCQEEGTCDFSCRTETDEFMMKKLNRRNKENNEQELVYFTDQEQVEEFLSSGAAEIYMKKINNELELI